ncbi:tRNA-methyltransferase non-catalytic subunit trm6MTase subunit [Melia azedarach]|uniref:tRNA-methyltransferase non-catalytic subunit trm6MTase subunit n=1 Tax=Melia azedarach TaxID=155640 RepID=A0ACC1WSF9_MELAZ|nr:tRNA-methyltransferase non-catalytic subunit trm6MTase subunit [Melia azedarach]
MDSFEFNSIKAEKAEAMRRYNRHKRLKNFFFFAEVFAALVVLSWSSYTYIPAAAEMAGRFLRHYVAVLAKPLYVFISINILIILISFLPSQKPTKPDFYDEYVTITTNNNNSGNVPRRTFTTADHSPTPEDTVVDKQIICVYNAVKNSPVEKNLVCASRLKDCEAKQAVLCPIQQKKIEAATETKKYTRTRSERLDRENQRELRRSETAIKREVAARRSCEMDDLSSEEFRMTIETFIAAKKKTLIRENTLDLKPEQKQCVAITLTSRN